jgi:hypothetical protein
VEWSIPNDFTPQNRPVNPNTGIPDERYPRFTIEEIGKMRRQLKKNGYINNATMGVDWYDDPRIGGPKVEFTLLYDICLSLIFHRGGIDSTVSSGGKLIELEKINDKVFIQQARDFPILF